MNKTLLNATKKVLDKGAVKDANSICMLFFHQPKAPEKLKKFSKIK